MARIGTRFRRGLLLSGVAIVVGLLVWFAWLQFSAHQMQWAMERIGGHAVLYDTRLQPDPDEERFLKALSLAPTPALREWVMKPEICRGVDARCALVNLAMLNFMMLGMPDEFSNLNTLDLYINHWKDQGGTGCPAVEEISAMVRASSRALTQQGDARARSAQEAFARFQAHGGVLGAMDSNACKAYFAHKPFMARAYLAHLGYLLALAQGKNSMQAAYLLSLPTVFSILKYEGP
ncbi:hypothetical protein DMX06_10415 [Pseudomonas mosselii]|nr:hypothetical protein DMX06_10415 [Pseudomonas mosselii]